MMHCRHCDTLLEHVFVDLGFAPASNAYLKEDALRSPELYYPLRVLVCQSCWLVQTDDYTDSGLLFDDEYAYFSSVSSTWLEHARTYCDMIVDRLSLGRESMVVELASNDGYLLRNFVDREIPCLGVEPTASTAAAAREHSVPVLQEFFSEALANKMLEDHQADLIIGNNVYAHVPDINDFTAGIARLLKPEGVVTLEFPHVQQLIEHGQFDTVYHEHFSYLSMGSVSRIFVDSGLRVFDVEQLPTHGGSLRIYGCLDSSERATTGEVEKVLSAEQGAGLQDLETYTSFQQRADAIKDGLLSFLLEARARGEKVCAYGAAAKGNTLLNYAGIKPDLLQAVYDAAASKQGKYLPGSHIPIRAPEEISNDRPNWLLILPWNIAPEILAGHGYVKDWGCRFLVAVPELRTLS